MSSLTPRQRQVLDFIRLSLEERGFPPSVREIGRALGLNSSSTVHGHLSKLKVAGLINWDPTKPRTISLAEDDGMRQRIAKVPLVGRVTAGLPVLAEENVEDVLPLPADFARGNECFLLRVRGDSMTGAGILDGDYVIVRKQENAENGEVVVALLGEEATVKRFFREEDRVRLQPENDAFEPIITRDVKILGKIVGLLRRLG